MFKRKASSVFVYLTTLVAVLVLMGCRRPEGEVEPSAEESKKLVVVSYGGGAYQQSHIDAFIKPFEVQESVRVESVVWGAEFGRLIEMVRSGGVKWDVVEVTAAQFERGRDEGELFEPLRVSIDQSVFRPLEGGPPIDEFGAPNVYWSTVLAHKRGTFPQGRIPETWSDFWDVDRFPGERALYDDPRGNLEFALLGDGVLIAELYPLDVERAFSALDRIKPHIRVWWSDGTQPVGLLLNGDVVLSSAWSGRIFASETARNEISYSWAGAAHELDYWVIPKGSKNADLASRFILFASSPLPMARQAAMTAYGPANALALEKVEATVLAHLPTEATNWSKSFVIDAAWWAEHEAELSARWVSWKNQ